MMKTEAGYQYEVGSKHYLNSGELIQVMSRDTTSIPGREFIVCSDGLKRHDTKGNARYAGWVINDSRNGADDIARRKDFFGVFLRVGDSVACMTQLGGRQLASGIITRFTPKRVRIATHETGRSGRINTIIQSENQLIKRYA
tara:strand:+ start:165 stop:590 length:426 start_codon:yes stop_codon:yes gene_type:complete